MILQHILLIQLYLVDRIISIIAVAVEAVAIFSVRSILVELDFCSLY